MKLIGKSLLIGLSIICFAMTSQGQEGQGEASEAEAKQPTIEDFVFNDAKELNTSLAVKKQNGRFYLIIETDHNFNRNSFTLSTKDIGLYDFNVVRVSPENLAFGFNNKFVAVLPLVELMGDTTERGPRNIVMVDKEISRTQQQIDLTQFLKSVAESNALIDTKGKAYALAEIAELSFMIGAQEEGGPRQLKKFNVNLGELVEGESRQVYGAQKVADIPIRSTSSVAEVLNLSPQVLRRYLAPFMQELQAGQRNIKTPERLSELVDKLPLELTGEQKQLLVEKLLLARTAEELMKSVFQESLQSPVKKSAAFCRNIFAL